MTINRSQNHLKETWGLKDRQSSGWPRKMLAHKTVILWRHHDVMVIKRPEKWFAVCLLHLEPEFVLKRRNDIFIFKRHCEKHLKFENMDKIEMFITE